MRHLKLIYALGLALLFPIACKSKKESASGVKAIASIQALTDGQYVLRSVNINNCLDVPGTAKTSGLQLQLRECDNAPSQLFQIKLLTKTTFTLVNAGSLKAVQVRDASKDSGAVIEQSESTGRDQQIFRLKEFKKGDNRFAIMAESSQMVLAPEESSKKDGVKVIQRKYDDGLTAEDDDLLWTLEKSAKGTATTVPVLTIPAPAEPISKTGYPNDRGAIVPWTEYQAEDGISIGRIIGPDRTRYDSAHIEAEAVGRKAVRLEKVGDFVAIVAKSPGNSAVVRYSIPDSAKGGGQDATLGLYVAGKRVKTLALTSKYSWVYGGETATTPNTPGAEPHTFFDEARTLVDAFPAGTEIKLQKDAEDKAEFYVIDLIDLEQVAPPETMPPDALSIADFGAIPNDAIDDGPQILKAIAAAVLKNKSVWIPQGTFLINSVNGNETSIAMTGETGKVSGTLKGAGMWYSTLKGPKASLSCKGTAGCKFSDFAILGEADRRDDKIPNNGFNGMLGKGTTVSDVWVEHVKIGMSVGSKDDMVGTEGLTVKNSRFRNTYAEGLKFENGTHNSTVENSHFRNTGDDAMTMYSYKGGNQPAVRENVFSKNSVQMPWRANCFALYGGSGNRIEDSVCEDVLAYPGIMVANNFTSHPFDQDSTIKNMSVIRGGGAMFGENWAAVAFDAPQGDVANIVLQNVDIVEPTYAGMQFRGTGGSFSKVTVDGVKMTNPGTFSMQASTGVQGAVTFSDVVVTGPRKVEKDSSGVPESFFNRLNGNTGW